jgi:hypothetical protein
LPIEHYPLPMPKPSVALIKQIGMTGVLARISLMISAISAIDRQLVLVAHLGETLDKRRFPRELVL